MKFTIAIVVICTNLLHLRYANAQDEVCQSILQVAASNTNCEPLGDCTGISCYAGDTINKTVTVAVNKCTDPLEVNITVYNGDESVDIDSMSVVTGAGVIAGTGHTVQMFERDAFELNISVSYNPTDTIAVPKVRIPLNSSDCMCEAIKSAGENVEAPTESDHDCQVNTQCNGQECSFLFGAITFYFESDILPCANPPGMVFVVRDTNMVVVSEFYFNANRNITLLNAFPMSIFVEQKEYSIIVEGLLFDDNRRSYMVLPRTQVILDQTMCLNGTTTVPLPSIAATPMPGSFISPATCQAISDIRDSTNQGGFTVCNVNIDCDTLVCTSFEEYTSTFQLLPCEDPPAVHLQIFDNNVNVYNGIIRNTSSVPITNTIGSLVVEIVENDDSVILQADVDLGFGLIPIIARSTVPIDICYCPMSECGISPTPSMPSTSSSSVDLVIYVVIPVVIVVVVLIVIVVVIVLVLVLYKRKGSRPAGGKGKDDFVKMVDNLSVADDQK